MLNHPREELERKMDEDMEKCIKSCSVCNSCKLHQQRAARIVKNASCPNKTMVLGSKVFLWNQGVYLVVVGYQDGLNSTHYMEPPLILSSEDWKNTLQDLVFQTCFTQTRVRNMLVEILYDFHRTGVLSMQLSFVYSRSNGLVKRAVRPAKERLGSVREMG